MHKGYDTPTLPAKDAQSGLNFLKDTKLQADFRKDLIELIRIAPPESLGIYAAKKATDTLKLYIQKLLELLEAKPYLVAELKGTVRISWADLSETDKLWMRKALEEEAYKLRSTMDNTAFKSRISPTETKGWLEFRTIDCVFAAILAALGFNPGKSRLDVGSKDLKKLLPAQQQKALETSEKTEIEAEDWLAQQLHFVRRVTPDVALIYVLEQQFGWERVADGLKVSEFKAGTAAQSCFILSYQRNGDDWHTVFLDHPDTAVWTVTDRQGTALGKTAVNDNGLCDAWLVDRDTPGFQALQEAFNHYKGD